MVSTVLLATSVRWPWAAWLAAAFDAAGARVEVLAPGSHPIEASRYPARLHRYSPLRPQASLARAIEAAQPDLIVPCDDRSAAQLARLWRETPSAAIRARIAQATGNPAIHPVLADRARSIEAAAAAGVTAPPTLPVRDETTLRAAIAGIGFPSFLKVNGSWGGDGVAMVRGIDEAHAAWRRLGVPPPRWRTLIRAMKRRDAHFIADALHPAVAQGALQAPLPGAIATSAVSAWRGDLLAANHFAVVETKGRGGPASVIAPIEDGAMQDACARIAGAFGLSGLFGLDFVRDAEGRAQLIEINPRAVQTAHLSFGDGHAPVAALMAAASGRAVASPRDTGRALVALFPQEWQRDPASAYLRDAFHDVPRADPALAAAVLPGWQGNPAPAVAGDNR